MTLLNDRNQEISRVWIYGAGGFASDVKRFLTEHSIEVVGTITKDGFFTNFSKGSEELYFADNCPVVIGVFNHRDNPIDIMDFLNERGITDVISPAKLFSSFAGVNFSKYYLTSLRDGLPTTSEIQKVKGYLQDPKSIFALESFLNYQRDGEILSIYRSAQSNLQYLGTTLPSPFDSKWMNGIVNWLDVGAYDGDTLRGVTSFVGNGDTVNFLCIEPDLVNFSKLKSCAVDIAPTTLCLNVAIGATSGEILFKDEGTLSSSGSVIEQSDNTAHRKVEMRTVDEVCHQFVPTHIKMDIEGAEKEALHGALHTLETHRPKLAISLYHRPRDIVEIPLMLMELLPCYSWFIRCYGAHGYDTILYGISSELDD